MEELTNNISLSSLSMRGLCLSLRVWVFVLAMDEMLGRMSAFSITEEEATVIGIPDDIINKVKELQNVHQHRFHAVRSEGVV